MLWQSWQVWQHNTTLPRPEHRNTLQQNSRTKPIWSDRSDELVRVRDSRSRRSYIFMRLQCRIDTCLDHDVWKYNCWLTLCEIRRFDLFTRLLTVEMLWLLSRETCIKFHLLLDGGINGCLCVSRCRDGEDSSHVLHCIVYIALSRIAEYARMPCHDVKRWITHIITTISLSTWNILWRCCDQMFRNAIFMKGIYELIDCLIVW